MGDNSILTVDFSQLLQGFEEFRAELVDKLDLAAKKLAIETEMHIKEQAQQKLHARREEYIENLDFAEIGKGTYAVILYADARWIEDGTKARNMLEDLLASPKAKTSKKGTKYLIIPFKHSKKPSSQGKHERQLLSAINQEMKRRGIPKGIERKSNGSPKVGLLHSFDTQGPAQKHQVGPGLMGPQGQHHQTKPRGSGQEGPGGRPYLWGTRIYQNVKKDAKGKAMMGGDGHPEVEKSTFTFRVASSTQQGKGMWDHPGNQPVFLFEEAHQWAQSEFDNRIGPEIIKSLGF